jgi:epoxyqueuosine reductase
MPAITTDLPALAQSIKDWGRELGFQQVGISGLDLAEHEQHLQRWLDAGYHGEMDYMGAHGSKRSHPDELVPGTLRVVSLRMDYLPGDTQMAQMLAQPEKAYISRYALGRDYHKLIRKRVQQLADRFRRRSARSAFAPSSTAPRCWKKPSPNRPAWAGSARTPWCSTARPAAISS